VIVSAAGVSMMKNVIWPGMMDQEHCPRTPQEAPLTAVGLYGIPCIGYIFAKYAWRDVVPRIVPNLEVPFLVIPFLNIWF